MPLERKVINKIINIALKTRPVELGCYECLDELHRFAEVKLVNKEVPEALKLVEQHLQMCRECRDEYTALMEALKGISGEA